MNLNNRKRLAARIHKLADDLSKFAKNHQQIVDDVDRLADEDLLTEAFEEITAEPEYVRSLLDPSEDKSLCRKWLCYVLERAWPIHPELLISALRVTLKRGYDTHHDPIRSKGQAEENVEYARAEAAACKTIAKLFLKTAKDLEKRAVEYAEWQDAEP